MAKEKALERIGFRITKDLKQKLEARADEEGRTLSNLINYVLADYIEKIEEAKKNGQWDAPKATAITEEQIACVCALLKGIEPAFANFQAMSLSVQKTYTRAYLDAKTDAGRKKRLAWMVDRLNQNLKPM